MSTPFLRLTAAAAIGCGLLAAAALPAAAAVPSPITSSAEDAAFTLDPVGTYSTGVFDASAAEIVAHYAPAQRLLVVNAAAAVVEVLSITDPTAPVKLFDLQTTGIVAADGSIVPPTAVANSVAVRADGLGAVAVESDPKTDAGWIVFFDAAGTGTALGAVRVGALPDMVTFTPDGTMVVVANEGEPADDYSVDPEGSVSVITVPNTVGVPTQGDVRTADFRAFETGLDPAVRVFGGREDASGGTVIPDFPVSENLEPEYATVAVDSTTAWVSLQEANAIAEIDLATATVTAVRPLGTVDRLEVPMDASDRDDVIDIRTWPVLGFPMPDTLRSYRVGGSTYLVSANEGDSRDWDGYSEVARVKDLGADGLAPVCDTAFDEVAGTDGLPADLDGFLADEALGRLNITTADGLSTAGDCYETLYTYGTRSFSIWGTDGTKVWDSADAFEQITAEAMPEFFNSSHTASELDNRSDDKGPEPEGLAVGAVDGRTYAFIGFERVGGIAAFDITDPADPAFVTYVNNRDFSVSADDDGLAGAGDLGPEGLAFIAAADSPTGEPMLAVGNEVSGTTTLYSVALAVAPVDPTPSASPSASVAPVPTPTPSPSGGVGGVNDVADDADAEAEAARARALADTGASAAGPIAAAAALLLGGIALLVTGRVTRSRRRSG